MEDRTQRKGREGKTVSQRRQLRQIIEVQEGHEEGSKESGEPEWMQEYEEVFADPEGVSREGGVQHKIMLREGSRCHRRAAYRMALGEREVLKKELEEFWARGWIRPSTSEWATVALVVPKKDNTARVCIDYRDLNALTVQDGYPLLKIDELLQKMARSRWFSKVDLKSGFYQIPIEENNVQDTAFRIAEPV